MYFALMNFQSTKSFIHLFSIWVMYHFRSNILNMKISHSKCSSSARKRRKEKRRMHRAKVSKHRDSRGTGTKRSTKSVINKGPSKSHTSVGHIKKKNSHIAKGSLTPLYSGNKKGSTTSNIKSSKTSTKASLSSLVNQV